MQSKVSHPNTRCQVVDIYLYRKYFIDLICTFSCKDIWNLRNELTLLNNVRKS